MERPIEVSLPQVSELTRERFLQFLERAGREVATWPEWKRNALGWWKDEQVPASLPQSVSISH